MLQVTVGKTPVVTVEESSRGRTKSKLGEDEVGPAPKACSMVSQ